MLANGFYDTVCNNIIKTNKNSTEIAPTYIITKSIARYSILEINNNPVILQKIIIKNKTEWIGF